MKASYVLNEKERSYLKLPNENHPSTQLPHPEPSDGDTK